MSPLVRLACFQLLALALGGSLPHATGVASAERCWHPGAEPDHAPAGPTDEANDAISAQSIIWSFYQQYLQRLEDPPGERPALRMTSDFASEIEKNLEICAKHAEGVCGFGTGGDIYLDSQEYEIPINSCSAGVRVSESRAGWVEVTLNVYPSLADPHYDRHITFSMLKDQAGWAVDDILYSGVSARQQIHAENASHVVLSARAQASQADWMEEPLFGIAFNPAEVHFESHQGMPACMGPQLAATPYFVFAKAELAGHSYSVLGHWIETGGDGSAPPHREPSFGIVLSEHNGRCSVLGTPDHLAEATSILPEGVREHLLANAADRYLAAFGSPAKLTAFLQAAAALRRCLPAPEHFRSAFEHHGVQMPQPCPTPEPPTAGEQRGGTALSVTSSRQQQNEALHS